MQQCSQWHYIQPAVISQDTVETMRGADSQKLNCICSVHFHHVKSLKMHSFKKNTYQTSSGVFLDIFTYLELELGLCVHSFSGTNDQVLKENK